MESIIAPVKAPKKVKARKKGNTGKRYSEAQRKKILDFIAASGHGGITSANKKWGVSYIAIRSWLKKGGAGKGAKAGRKPGRPKGKPGRPAGSGKGRGRPAAVKPGPVLSKRAHRKIQKALGRMGHGIRMLAEAFSHLV